MSDPNAATGTHSPGPLDQHPNTVGWVPPPDAAARDRPPPAANAPAQTAPAGSTPGPNLPGNGTDSDSTEQMDPPGAQQRGLPRLPPVPGFDVLAYIGRGGMGVVYRALQRATGRTVALKIINPSGVEDPITRERFDREVRALAALKHPNIVPVYEAGEWHGFPYCAMEFASGGTLSAHLARVRADLRAAIQLMAKVARAVAAMHTAGVLHRDLKPLNILLGDDDEPMLADFGLARRLDDDSDLTYTGLPVGTRQYMAPEQTLGRRDDYTPACDIWALGVTLFEVLTGERPFTDDGPTDIYHRIRFDDPAACASFGVTVPPELEAVARHCLEKRPEDRYASAAAVADDLENWLAGRAVTAPPVPVLVPVPMPVAAPSPTPAPSEAPTDSLSPEPVGRSRRVRTLAIAGALVMLVVAGAVAARWALKSPAQRVADGETVKFTNEKGVPTVKWDQTTGHEVTPVSGDYHWFKSTTGPGIVALADEPWQGPIRVTAKIAVQYVTTSDTCAGVYVGRRSWSNPDLEHESLVWFGVGPRWNAKDNRSELACLADLYWWESKRPGSPAWTDSARHPWGADDPRFADVVIDVRENEIKATVDGVKLTPLTKDFVLQELNKKKDERLHLPIPKFVPPAFGTGIGIFLRNAECTVVDLSVSKLTP